MRRFYVLLKKELRELITPQLLLPLVVVILMFLAIGQLLGASTPSGAGYPVQVLDADHTPASALVVSALKKSGFDPHTVTSWSGTPEAGGARLAQNLPHSGGNVVVVIPSGFEKGLQAKRPQQIQTWAIVRTFSFLGSRDVGTLTEALAAVNQSIAEQVARQAAPSVPVEMLRQPVKVVQHVVVGSNQAQTSADTVIGFVGQQTTFIPIVLFVVIIFAAQMIATAIASEKENKTLETLLSYPISRTALVIAKMVAAGLVALAAAAVYMLGIRSYMSGIAKGLGGESAAGQTAATATAAVMRHLGLTLGPAEYALLGLTLFAGILVALAMAMILGAFAESVKSVQAMLMPLIVLLMVPYFLTLFVDLQQVPNIVRWIVLAIPFTYPFLAGPNLFLGNYAAVWFGIAYQLVWFVALAILAGRIFSSDRILTMKLSFGRGRGRRMTAEGQNPS